MFVMMHLRCSHVHCVFVSSIPISEKSDMSPETGKFEDFRVKHSSATVYKNSFEHKAGVSV